MQPTAKVFYGVFLKSTPFCVASYAWNHVEPVLRAMALIRTRRVKGTLKVEEGREGRASLASMPEEILELIVEELVRIEMKAAENTLVRDLYHSGDEDGCGCSSCRWQSRRKLSLSHLAEEECCWEYFYEQGGVSGLVKKCKERTATLLAHFGLRTLTDTALSDVEDPFIKSDCFTPVSLLPLSTPSTVLTPSTSIPIYAEDPNTSHTAVDLASALESLPSNAPVRFRELLRLFPLSNSYPGVHNARVEKEYDEKKIKEAQEKGGKGGKAWQEAKEKAEEIVVRKEAGWHLWGDGSSVSGW